MIQPHEAQDRGVQVVDVDAVVDGAEAELVGGADDLAAPDAAACIRNASSYAAIRAASSLSSPRVRRCSAFSALRRSSLPRCRAEWMSSGGARCRIGLGPLRNCVPWYVAGMKPVLQLR